jgi:hypothetical protein
VLASLVTTIFTIFLGSLQLSASAYGSTTFESDLAAATGSTLLIAFVLAVHLVLGYHFSWPKRKLLPIMPTHTATMIPYVIYSSGLREDLKEVADINSTTGKIKGLNDLYRRYGLGKFDSSAMENIASIRFKRHNDGVSAARLLD